MNVILEKGRKIKVIIEDFGLGISKKALPPIFERVYREEEARNREIKSYGLGLSIVGGLNKFQLEGTKITIDKDKTSEEVLPDTKLAEEKDENKDRKIIDNYTKKDDQIVGDMLFYPYLCNKL